MTVVRWDPFRNMTALQDRINRLFEDAFPQSQSETEVSLCAWQPSVDIYENNEGVVIKVDLPGLEKEDISVEIKENVLTLKGQRKEEVGVPEEAYFRKERTCGTFHRSFSLRSMIDPESIKATFKNGVLTIEIPKPEEEKPKQVEVNIE